MRFLGVGMLLIAGLLLPAAVFAETYTVEDALQLSEDAAGTRHTVLNIQATDYLLDRIAARAGEPPVVFESDAQRDAAAADLQALLGILDLVLQDDPEQKAILWRLGFGWSLAYNMGVPDSAGRADAAFRRLFKLDPDHLKGNYFYGAHLTHVPGREAEGMRLLHKSADAGLPEAFYTLGYAHLRGGQDALALRFFKRYAEYYPQDAEIRELIQNIPAGGEAPPLLPAEVRPTKIQTH